MHDGPKIIAGLLVFVVLALSPLWSAAVLGAGPKPVPKIVTTEKECVLPREEIRATHMELLNSWRDQVVREGRRTTLTSSGKTVSMSLTGTCLGCHSNKAEFCDSCHNYAAAAPYCWDCHTEPKERT